MTPQASSKMWSFVFGGSTNVLMAACLSLFADPWPSAKVDSSCCWIRKHRQPTWNHTPKSSFPFLGLFFHICLAFRRRGWFVAWCCLVQGVWATSEALERRDSSYLVCRRCCWGWCRCTGLRILHFSSASTLYWWRRAGSLFNAGFS